MEASASALPFGKILPDTPSVTSDPVAAEVETITGSPSRMASSGTANIS